MSQPELLYTLASSAGERRENLSRVAAFALARTRIGEWRACERATVEVRVFFTPTGACVSCPCGAETHGGASYCPPCNTARNAVLNAREPDTSGSRMFPDRYAGDGPTRDK